MPALQAKTIRESQHESSRQMMPADANPMGNVYGGSIIKYIDEVAGVCAHRHCHSKAVTASIERMDFIEPVLIGDLLLIKAALIYTGRTSMIVGVKVEAENLLTAKRVKTGTCYLTFVAVDDRGRPTPVPPVAPTDDEERRWQERGKELYEQRKRRLGEQAARR